MKIDAGFLIVKTYEQLYNDHVSRYDLHTAIYAVPRIDQNPNSYSIQYRGIDRDALDSYCESDKKAELKMAELEEKGDCKDGFLFSESIVRDVVSCGLFEQEYEIIWARRLSSGLSEPKGFCFVGYEPTFFEGDHFSASCDCMLMPRWHGTDKEGTLFLNYFKMLNQYGLFTSVNDAEHFLQFYLSFDWTETGDYTIAEIFVKEATIETGDSPIVG